MHHSLWNQTIKMVVKSRLSALIVCIAYNRQDLKVLALTRTARSKVEPVQLSDLHPGSAGSQGTHYLWIKDKVYFTFFRHYSTTVTACDRWIIVMEKAAAYCLQIWAGNINKLCFWNVHHWTETFSFAKSKHKASYHEGKSQGLKKSSCVQPMLFSR